MTGELETRVAVLERDVNQMGNFFEKLDSTMEKLADVSSSIKELLAVHELKLTQQENLSTELFTLIENRRVETDKQNVLFHSKLVDSEKELKKDMDDFNKKILQEMKELRNELKSYRDESVVNKNTLDKYKWAFLVVAVLISFILYKMGVIPFLPPFLG
jgi:hypothetical protein